MRPVVSSDRVAASVLSLIEHPGCQAYCIARAENKAMAEAYDDYSSNYQLRTLAVGSIKPPAPTGAGNRGAVKG